MATNPATTENTISEQDLEEVGTLLHDLKERANDANDRGNVIMLGLYAQLVKLVAPEVERLRARVEREDRAGINKKHKALRQARRAGNNGNTQQSA